MRKSLLVLTLCAWCLQACTSQASNGQSVNAQATDDDVSISPQLALIQQSGLVSLLNQIPEEIHLSAQRHAIRCSSTAIEYDNASGDMISTLKKRLDQQLDRAEALELVEWYKSSLGLKVQALEKDGVDEEAITSFKPDANRGIQIERIYQNTSTGILGAGVGVKIEYAGWLISGCKKAAEESGNERKLASEIQYSKIIKSDSASLELIFKNDTLHGMSYVFSKLSDDELTEFANSTEKYAHVYTVLVDELLDSIEGSYTLFVQ